MKEETIYKKNTNKHKKMFNVTDGRTDIFSQF